MPQFAELLSSPDCHCTTYMFQSVMVFDRTPEELHEYLKVPIPMPHVDRDAVGERRLMSYKQLRQRQESGALSVDDRDLPSSLTRAAVHDTRVRQGAVWLALDFVLLLTA